VLSFLKLSVKAKKLKTNQKRIIFYSNKIQMAIDSTLYLSFTYLTFYISYKIYKNVYINTQSSGGRMTISGVHKLVLMGLTNL
jgi:hypothetical protein